MKIPRKQLITLEPGISMTQTSQMQAADVQLIVPTAVQDTYAEAQKSDLWCLGDFVREVRRQQTAGDGYQTS